MDALQSVLLLSGKKKSQAELYLARVLIHSNRDHWQLHEQPRVGVSEGNHDIRECIGNIVQNQNIDTVG